MRRTLILTALLASLLVLYFVFFFDRQDSSLCRESINFAVEEVENIQRVSMRYFVDGEEEENIILDKQPDGDWTFNGGYNALELRVQTLLETLKAIRVRRTLSDQSLEKANALIDRNHIQVEIYGAEGLMREYLVGPQTRDLQGTVMRMAGDLPFWCAAQPRVVHIPGVAGYLNSRYTMEFDMWRENLLFDAQPEGLSRVSIVYAEPEHSVSLVRQGGKWSVQGLEVTADSQAIAAYLDQFEGKVYGESFAEKYFPNYIDTLKNQPPDVVFTLDYQDGQERRLLMYEREDNLNNYFGWVEGEGELITVQHFVIDKFLKKRSDFLFSF